MRSGIACAMVGVMFGGRERPLGGAFGGLLEAAKGLAPIFVEARAVGEVARNGWSDSSCARSAV